MEGADPPGSARGVGMLPICLRQSANRRPPRPREARCGPRTLYEGTRQQLRMILPRYRIAASGIPGAGLGLYLQQTVARGSVLIAPDAIPRTWGWDEIAARPDADALLPSSIRWFEDQFTVTPEWPDECYVNHAFAPTGIWHLGFVFAAAALEPGTEITVDYRHLLGEGQQEVFLDALTATPIIGLPWSESLRLSTEQLRGVLAA